VEFADIRAARRPWHRLKSAIAFAKGPPFQIRTGARIREKPLKTIYLLSLAMCATACQPLPAAVPSTSSRHAEGLAFAQTSCGGCHAVGRYGTSPNPNSPAFAGIVNQPGLTAETLSSWLRDAHNYPDEMKFSLEGRAVDDLVAYMLTLRDKDYRPPI
jgi:mono/diheme cytochrome c family protein